MCLFSFGWKKEIKLHLERMSKTHHPLICDIIAGDNKPVVLTYDNCRFDAKIKKGGEEIPLYVLDKNEQGETTICVNQEFYKVFKGYFEDIKED